MATTNHATERLFQQMLAIRDAHHAMAEHIAEADEARQDDVQATLSRRVALIIESLNSLAIDVSHVLAREVSDDAWAAYLKGDRSVFMRRTVRLLGQSDARTIHDHYQNDPSFAEHVNRYIHDFESMLRLVLTARDHGPLSLTLLSSDMGKLYVALAQAIERLRT